MPLRLTVSFSKKVGQPNYGSLGATCQVECELASDLLTSSPKTFQAATQEVYAACAQAVAAELARQSSPPDRPRLMHDAEVDAAADAPRNGHASRSSPPVIRAPRYATPPQIRAIRALSQKLLIDLNQVLDEHFHVERTEQLTVENASRLIQRLQIMNDRAQADL